MAKRLKKFIQAAVDRSQAEVEAIIAANNADPTKASYEGLTTSEIAAHNHRVMFRGGDVRPDDQEWALFTL